MRLVLCCVAASIAFSSAAFAQDAAPAPTAAVAAAEIKPGSMLVSADGKRIGRIERVTAEGTASIIFDSRFVYVPTSTISASDRGLVTSLSRSDVRRLK